MDNLEDAGLSVADAGAVSFTVPFRSFAPIVDIDDPDIFLGGGPTETNVLTLQYTGFQATGELRTFRRWNRARNIAEFREGLDEFDVGGQNWAYADAQGNLGYFSSAEVPLRADLDDGRAREGEAPESAGLRRLPEHGVARCEPNGSRGNGVQGGSRLVRQLARFADRQDR